MDPITQQIALASAGAGGAALYVDDVFSTYLYDGTGSSGQTITNGIDLSGEGGLYWMKNRTTTGDNMLFDTERASNKVLVANTSAGEATDNTMTPTSTGFTISGGSTNTNNSSFIYCSWTFRKAPGFFDVVTYTSQTGVTAINHNLGSVPGCIIIKKLNGNTSWQVYHRSTGATKRLELDGVGVATTNNAFGNTTPTSTQFFIDASSNDTFGTVGDQFVAYLFAHDDQSFGTNSDEAIIKCGSYTGTGSAGNDINVGFEPQFIITKNTTSTNEWFIYDSMRIDENGDQKRLNPSTTGAELTTADPGMKFNATGFTPIQNNNNKSGETFIYIAIRRPHKSPEAGTDVFAAQDGRSASDGSASQSTYTSGFPVDLIMRHTKASDSTRTVVFDRLRGENYLLTHSTAIEASDDFILFDDMDGVYRTSVSATTGLFAHMFKRAPGFFDMVAYTGTGSDLTVNHNLGAVPELIICRNRSSGTGRWYVYPGPLSSSEQKHFRLNEDFDVSSSASLDWAPTATTFNADTFLSLSTSGTTYIAYLFASLSGISKVGSYSGTGSNIDVDCGFAAGARFVLIKRTDSTGNWYVWDSTRGIVSGDDPYVLLDTATGQVTNTDYIDPLNAGFTVTSSAPAALNTSGGTYLFLAIA